MYFRRPINSDARINVVSAQMEVSLVHPKIRLLTFVPWVF
jgi:hypothetical protein